MPGNALGAAAGVPDRVEDAADFLRHVVGNRGGDDLRARLRESFAARPQTHHYDRSFA